MISAKITFSARLRINPSPCPSLIFGELRVEEGSCVSPARFFRWITAILVQAIGSACRWMVSPLLKSDDGDGDGDDKCVVFFCSNVWLFAVWRKGLELKSAADPTIRTTGKQSRVPILFINQCDRIEIDIKSKGNGEHATVWEIENTQLLESMMDARKKSTGKMLCMRFGAHQIEDAWFWNKMLLL